MPKSKKRAKAVAKQRVERQREQRVPSIPDFEFEDFNPFEVQLPVVRVPELDEVLKNRPGWKYAPMEGHDFWKYMPSLPIGWDNSYDGGPTIISPCGDNKFSVDPPSFSGSLNDFSPVYDSLDNLIADLDAIESWRYPVQGPPEGATGYVRLGGS